MESISDYRYEQLKRHFGTLGYETDFANHVARKQGTVAASAASVTVTDENIKSTDIVIATVQAVGTDSTLSVTKAVCTAGTATITCANVSAGDGVIQYVIFKGA